LAAYPPLLTLHWGALRLLSALRAGANHFTQLEFL
jgi:hypothetical protein